MIICFKAHSCSPFSRQEFLIVLPANQTCVSLGLLAQMSPQPPFLVKGDCLSRSVRGNSDRLGRRHELLVEGKPTISCTPDKTMRDSHSKECGQETYSVSFVLLHRNILHCLLYIFCPPMSYSMAGWLTTKVFQKTCQHFFRLSDQNRNRGTKPKLCAFFVFWSMVSSIGLTSIKRTKCKCFKETNPQEET